jgi:hypothetical protein
MSSLLSFGQERMWLLQQLDPAGTAYNVPMALRFHDGVDFEALDRALQALADRHPVLRWAFAVDESGAPVAAPMAGFRIPVARRTAGGDWRAYADELAAEPFDLAAAPPVRALVVECPDGSAVLCLVIHHIITDGRSLQILARDLPALYRSAALAPLGLSYADFVAWQRDGGSGDDLEYWRRDLDGFEPLRLPPDRPTTSTSGCPPRSRRTCGRSPCGTGARPRARSRRCSRRCCPSTPDSRTSRSGPCCPAARAAASPTSRASSSTRWSCGPSSPRRRRSAS